MERHVAVRTFCVCTIESKSTLIDCEPGRETAEQGVSQAKSCLEASYTAVATSDPERGT